MDIGAWLRELGLERYEEAFRRNEIDAEILPKLTAEDLKDVGVTTVGHRRKLLEAIAGLADPALATRREPSAPAEPAPRARPAEAERRQLTVLFCDLVGSTELSARLDPEDLRTIMGAYQVACAEVIGRFDGHVAKFLGDGVLVYFGWPRAHEDDAERAVRAGLGLLEAVAGLEARPDAHLQARVGIATGQVVVGDLISQGAADPDSVTGDAPNVAARLQALAPQGTVVIAEATRRLIGSLFELDNLGPQRLKGFDEPLAVWQVTAERRADGRFEAHQTTRLSPLIGRDEELSLLLSRWRQAADGDGQVVLLSGEPGIGKSRLVRELGERLQGEPHLRLLYQCSPHHTTSPLHPVIERLERAAGFARDDSPETRLDKLEALLASGTDRPEQAAPLIAALLGVPTENRYPALDLTPQRQKQLTLAALVEQLEGLAGAQPVLLAYEDMHWSDPTTQELLGLTIERVSQLRVLLLITYRPEFTPPWPSQAHVSTLALTRLGRREGAALVDGVVGAKSLPHEVSAQIVAKTDGVPLFIEELTKNVVESGLLMDSGDRYLVTGPVTPLAIPISLQASLLARLDRLGPARDVVQIAAALGRQFSHELISAVAAMPSQRLDDALAQLVHAELIFRRGAPPDAKYTFKHALVQDAAYDTLLRSRRQQLHARIAATLEDRFQDIVVAQPALLAQHCTEAGLAEKAVVYWLKAGRQAMARSAMMEAVAQLQKGLDVLGGLQDSPWRRQQELDLLSALRPALGATKGYSAPDVGETIARARALAEQSGRPEYLVRLVFGQWTFHLNRAEHKLALSLAEQFEKIGEARNDVAAQLQGRRAKGLTRLLLGEFVVARALLEQCHGLGDPAHRAVSGGPGGDPYALMLAHLAVTLAHLGYIDQARLQQNEAMSEARRLSHAHTRAVVLLHATWIASITRSPEMLRHAEELMALSTEHGFPYFLGMATAFRGASLTALGQAQEGLTLLTQGLMAIRATGTVQNTPHALTWCAEAYAMLGRAVEGLNCLGEAARMIETTDERYHEAELHRRKGEVVLCLSEPNRTEAERCFRKAMAVAQAQGAKLWELRAATSLARLWRDQGKRTQAHDLLAPIYGWFTEGFDTADLKDTKALLHELA